ncbi:hypothetical protein P7C70_g9356, partial [Phenoliferia sp. Uapishka_3]
MLRLATVNSIAKYARCIASAQEIHAKIMSLGFDDCKVYISNVDSQSSAEGGIIVQVIGEMSNGGRPWRKFAQTFFLAEQPNGFFVLNDIFRNIKEEGDEEEEAVAPVQATQESAIPTPVAAASVPVVDAPQAEVEEPVRDVAVPPTEPELEADPTPAESTAFPPFHPVDDAVTAPLTNGHHHEEPEATISTPLSPPATNGDFAVAEPIEEPEPEVEIPVVEEEVVSVVAAPEPTPVIPVVA